MEQATMPRPEEITKMTQSNALAAIVPQIMNAIGGGDQRTQSLLMNQQQQNNIQMEKQKEQMFMRSIMSPDTGEISPELIQQNAALYGVDPSKAMQLFMQFSAFKKQKAEAQKQKDIYDMGLEVATIPGLNKDNISSVLSSYNNDFAGTGRDSEVIMKGTELAKGLMPEVKTTPTIKVDTGDGGWKIIPKVVGQSGRENPPVGDTTNVNIDMSEKDKNKLTGKANEIFGTKVGESVNSTIDMAREANNQNAQLDTVLLALSNGAKTGYGEETIMNVKSLAQTLGVWKENLSGQELIRKISNEMALRLRNPDSGLGLTGNTSNKDLDFLKASVVGLNRTEQGNIEIIKAMKRFNKMKIDIANYQMGLIEENGGSIPLKLPQKVLKFANDYEIFTPVERAQIEGTSKGANVPQEAIEFLLKNPQFKDDFKAKYGYLPKGI